MTPSARPPPPARGCVRTPARTQWSAATAPGPPAPRGAGRDFPGDCRVARWAAPAPGWAARAGWRARPGRELVHGVLARRRRWGWVRGLVQGVLARARRAGFGPPGGAAAGGGLAWRPRARPLPPLWAGSRRARWRGSRRRRELVHGLLARRRRAGGGRRLVHGVLPGGGGAGGRAGGAGGSGGVGGAGNWCMGSWQAGVARGAGADWCKGFCQTGGGVGGRAGGALGRARGGDRPLPGREGGSHGTPADAVLRRGDAAGRAGRRHQLGRAVMQAGDEGGRQMVLVALRGDAGPGWLWTTWTSLHRRRGTSFR